MKAQADRYGAKAAKSEAEKAAEKSFGNKLAKGMEFGSFLQSAGSMLGGVQQQTTTVSTGSGYRARNIQRRRLR